MYKLLLILPLAAFIAATPTTTTDPGVPADINALLDKYGCAACHSTQRKLVGPKWQEIAAKGYTKKRIIQLVKKPEPGNWPGYPAMAPQATVPKADLDKIATWLVSYK